MDAREFLAACGVVDLASVSRVCARTDRARTGRCSAAVVKEALGGLNVTWPAALLDALIKSAPAYQGQVQNALFFKKNKIYIIKLLDDRLLTHVWQIVYGELFLLLVASKG